MWANLLSCITFIPLLGVLVLLFLPKEKVRLIRWVAIAITFFPLVLSAWLYLHFDPSAGGVQFTERHGWIEVPLNREVGTALQQFDSLTLKFDYVMGVDGLSLPLVFLTALVAFVAALGSIYIKKSWKTYYILFLLLEAGMLGVFMAQDLFLFFLFFETTLVPMFFLVGMWGYEHREKAANKFLLYNGVGSAIMLIGFLVLISTAGFVLSGNTIFYTGDLAQIASNLFGDSFAAVEGSPFFLSDALKWSAFVLLLIAFGIKLPIFPFHTWMLKVHVEAPPSIVMIHSGILLKMGAYGLLRFGILLFPEQAKAGAVVLAVLGLINVLYGAVLAFRQTDFKLVLAYSSISHMGVVLLGIASLNTIGLQGAALQLVSHGLISALLFLLVGALYERTGSTELEKLGGLAKPMPVLSGFLLFAGLASLGLPGLSGFAAEFMAFLGLLSVMKIITIVGTLGIILGAVYVLRSVLAVTYGPVTSRGESLLDVRWNEGISMAILAAFIILFGVYPGILTDSMQQTLSDFSQIITTTSMRIGG